MTRYSSEILRVLIASSTILTSGGCVSGELSTPKIPETAVMREVTPVITNPPTRTELTPTFTPIGGNLSQPTAPPTRPPTPETQVEERKIELEQTTSLVEIVETFPIYDSNDPYYPWYRWSGEKLFEPLAIPPGTVLTVPNPVREPPRLSEITVSPENWTEILAIHSTSLAGSSENRLFNIRLGAERLNGTIIEPYELFSVKETIGPADLTGGYVMGWGYEAGEEVPMEGGGVCQIPSTLFKPALESGMLVVERYAHEFYSERYGPWDATISPVLDFTFRNLYEFPIQIRAEISQDNQNLRMEIWSPHSTLYNRIKLEVLYNEKDENGYRDAAVKQEVVYGDRVRVREYQSRYEPKE